MTNPPPRVRRLRRAAVLLRPAFLFAFALVSVLGAFAAPASAQYVVRESDEEEVPTRRMALPYAFKSETLDFAFGAAGGISGYLQEQSSVFGALLGSTNGSYAAFLAVNDLRMPYIDRLFMNLRASFGHYSQLRAYRYVVPGYAPNAGSNSSSGNNYRQGEGWDNWVDLHLRYILPIGHGRDNIVSHYVVEDGLLKSGASGGETWNPLASGRTSFELKPFYRCRTYNAPWTDQSEKTNGIEASLEYDNTDYKPSPSTGSIQKITLTRDFGLFDSTDSWTSIEGEFAKFFDLGAPSGFRQITFGVNAWSAYALTWEESTLPGGFKSYSHRPPEYMGATLGGYDRLKAYPFYRFNDRASIYYNAELRLIPTWNPFPKIPLINLLRVDWWQPVLFFEAGRVAENWNVGELHSDMKWNAGLGLRFMVEKAVVRVDTAAAPDSWGLWAMVGQSF